MNTRKIPALQANRRKKETVAALVYLIVRISAEITNNQLTREFSSTIIGLQCVQKASSSLHELQAYDDTE